MHVDAEAEQCEIREDSATDRLINISLLTDEIILHHHPSFLFRLQAISNLKLLLLLLLLWSLEGGFEKMMSAARCSSKHPFTANQWQELEHQATIYKHLVSGVPIPPELLFPFRRSLGYSSATNSRLFPHQPNAMDWSCFQLGFGRKLDPEPGRCRRTDGKKWRCSKDAFADSKYCERHMHRGRNRSRKPVELAISASTPPTTNPSSSYQNHPSLHPFLYTHHHTHSSPPPHGLTFSPQINSPHATLDSPFDRYAHGVKNERAFFSEASGTLRNMMPQSSLEDDPWQLTPLRMSSSSSSQISPKEGNYSVLQSGDYSHLQLHGFDDDHSKSKQHEQEQHCFVWGTDFKSQRESAVKMEREEPQEQPLRHFFN